MFILSDNETVVITHLQWPAKRLGLVPTTTGLRSVKTFLNRTEQKERMKTTYQLFDSLLEPCFVINKELKVVYCNETASVVCGLTIRKIQRTNFRELFTFSEPLEWLDGIEGVTDATAYKEVHFRTSEGGEGKIQITCQELPEGDERHWLIFVRDVTLEERLQKKYRGELEQKEGYILELQKAQAELEKYSKNLEKMVEERTAEIRKLNQLMQALLDSLSQGFFVFDRAGNCLDFSSKACETVLEGRPNNKPVWDVLKLPGNKVEGFKKWLLTLFAEMLPFEDLAPLGPPSYPHSANNQIKLEYFPLQGETGTMDGVVVVASDITSLVEAQREAETERENAKLILNLVNKRQQISRFVRETQSLVRELARMVATPPADWNTEDLFRLLHTIKGGAATFNLLQTAKAAHEAETRLSFYREEPQPQRAQDLTEQCRMVGAAFEEFLAETQKMMGAATFSEERFVEVPVQELRALCAQLTHWTKGSSIIEQLQNKYIFEPAGSFFAAYDEVIQKVASSEGKSVRPLQVKNGRLPILPEAYASLFACFVHAFRNAIDHGIELPSTRIEKGKPEAGTIEVELIQQAGRLEIRVQDDGNGIDPAKIRERLEKRGVVTQSESDQQVIQHVFDSSFSTRDIVTETSGRGVGMDAIRAAAQALGGDCRVESRLGHGTLLIVAVPWIVELPSSLKAA